jgi:ketosteroid isomerase-like protein
VQLAQGRPVFGGVVPTHARSKNMKKNVHASWSLCAGAIFLLMPALAAAQNNAEEIMALAKAQWAAENANKPAAEAWASVADDYTEFNPVVPVLVEGKAMAAKFYEASLQGGDTGVVSEMLNPHVQFYGDVAILSYNYAGMNKTKDGNVEPVLAKSTRVYAKKGGKWMLVHANFAPTPMPMPD